MSDHKRLTTAEWLEERHIENILKSESKLNKEIGGDDGYGTSILGMIFFGIVILLFVFAISPIIITAVNHAFGVNENTSSSFVGSGNPMSVPSNNSTIVQSMNQIAPTITGIFAIFFVISAVLVILRSLSF